MRPLLLGFVLAGTAAAGTAQQPFVTDDAATTPKSDWHFEYFNQYAFLARKVAPDLRQDWNNFVIQYGVLDRMEANVDVPVLAIVRSSDSQLPSAFGFGDLDFALKYRLFDENPNGIAPAFTMSAAVELPTGDKAKQLGSGYTDFVLNSITQKSITESTTLHLNLGYQLSGNTLTGAIGIRTPGHILTGGVSVVTNVSKTLLLGLDLNGAHIRTKHTTDGQLQLTGGGNYEFRKGMTFDFALLGGWFSSPRFGMLVGISITPGGP